MVAIVQTPPEFKMTIHEDVFSTSALQRVFAHFKSVTRTDVQRLYDHATQYWHHYCSVWPDIQTLHDSYVIAANEIEQAVNKDQVLSNDACAEIERSGRVLLIALLTLTNIHVTRHLLSCYPVVMLQAVRNSNASITKHLNTRSQVNFTDIWRFELINILRQYILSSFPSDPGEGAVTFINGLPISEEFKQLLLAELGNREFYKKVAIH